MSCTWWPVLLVLLALVAGWCAGAAGRHLLCRLRRGVALRPPWCEIAVALSWAVAVGRAGGGALPVWWLPVPLALAWWGVLLAGVDLARRRLPDALTLPGYPVCALLVATVSLAGADGDVGLRAAVGAVLFGAAHAVPHLFSPRAMGAGDVKLSGVLGAVLAAVSWASLLVGAVLAAAVTAVLGIVRRVGIGLRAPRGPVGVRAGPVAVPHGPGMLVATWVLVVFPAFGT